MAAVGQAYSGEEPHVNNEVYGLQVNWSFLLNDYGREREVVLRSEHGLSDNRSHHHSSRLRR